MKNKHLILLLLVLIYSLLFLRQDHGWNVLFIAVMIPFTQWVYHPWIYRNKFWWFTMAGFLIASLAVALNGSNLAVTAFFISTAFLSATVKAPGTSVFTSILWALFSSIGSFFINLVDQYSVVEKMERKNTAWFNPSIAISTIIPIILIILFLVYTGAQIRCLTGLQI